MTTECPAQAFASLRRCHSDPAGVYMGLKRLNEAVRQAPESVEDLVVDHIEALLASPKFATQSKAFFIFREATQTLALLVRFGAPHIRQQALLALQRCVFAGQGTSRHAAAEAAGALPLDLAGPTPESFVSGCAGVYPPDRIPSGGEGERRGPWRWAGRSLWAPMRDGRVFVCKCLRRGGHPETLYREAAWLNWLSTSMAEQFGVFGLETMDGYPLFELDLSKETGVPPDIGSRPTCLGFWAPARYFAYLNAPWAGKLDLERCGRGLRRCAYELGLLAGYGVVHTDPIALFHNQIQYWRRGDGGRYQWYRGGRLDQWLASCRHPNLGLDGLRDFEHLVPCTGGGRRFFHALGDHFLSLALVAGSCFRFQAPERVGTVGSGEPVDTRDLFDAEMLAEWLEGCFFGYYAGFTQKTSYQGQCPIPVARIARELVEAFGRDLHMVEILRQQDLEYMGREGVLAYLSARGVEQGEANRLWERGEEIPVASGPHLGEFNSRLNTPALLDYVAQAAALCVAGRYLEEQGVTWPDPLLYGAAATPAVPSARAAAVK